MKCSMANRVAVPRDLASITTFDPAKEVDPASVGLTNDGVEEIWGKVEELYKTGLHPAISLCIRRHGEVVIDRALGHASGMGPDEPPGTEPVLATPDTPFCIFSASKAITAILIHHLDDQGLIHIDDRVSEYIPEFGVNGKETATIRHVLTHRAGIPSVAGHGNDPDLLLHPERIVQLLSAAKPDSPPGRRLAYHAVTGGFVLGEVVKRVTGKTIRDYMHDTVIEPLGFEWMNFGVEAERVPLVAKNYCTGPGPPWPLSAIIARALGVPLEEAVEISNDVPYLTQIVPAGNIVATANEVSRFYQILLNEGELDGKRVFDRRTVHRAAQESSFLEVDLMLGIPLRYGLGMMLGGKYFSLYGLDTAQAFGHLGFIEIITWADPARQIAGALLTSGKPSIGIHMKRVWDVMTAISRCCPAV